MPHACWATGFVWWHVCSQTLTSLALAPTAYMSRCAPSADLPFARLEEQQNFDSPPSMAGSEAVCPEQPGNYESRSRSRSLPKKAVDLSEDLLPLQHVITAELYLPRDFAASLLVHVAQEPSLINVLQVRLLMA
jgi:hypothetical protein